MSMKKADIILALKNTLRESGNQLDDKFDEILLASVNDYSRHKPLTGIANLSLVAEQSVYDAPADLLSFKSHDWGRAHRKRRDPWNCPKIVAIPDVKVVPSANQTPTYQLALNPVPTAEDLSLVGSTMQYFYTRKHLVSDGEPGTDGATTIPENDLALLLLRMQAEAMMHLSFKRVGKTSTRDPLTKMTNRSGLPAELYRQLLEEFEKRVRA
jgi:hypothetical protein